MERLRVLIADDHPLFREGMHGLLDSIPETEVVGEVTTGAESIAQAKALQPDVILMDIKMPDINGIEATREIVAVCPHISILMVTMLEDDESVFAAMRAGARGYVLKGANQSELLRAIRAVASGEAIFGPGIARRVLSFFAAARPPLPSKVFPELSEREIELLDLMAHGHSNQEIADQLGLTLKTVRNHASNIFSKLQVADRTHAVLRAREAGLGNSKFEG